MQFSFTQKNTRVHNSKNLSSDIPLLNYRRYLWQLKLDKAIRFESGQKRLSSRPGVNFVNIPPPMKIKYNYQ